MAPVQTPPASTPSATERLTQWASDNKRSLLIGLGVTAVAGGALYYFSQQSSTPGEGTRRRKKKRSRGTPREGSGKGEDASSTGQAEAGDAADEFAALLNTDTAAIAALSGEDRKSRATELKSHGNKAYAAKKYQRAIQLYTKAIEYEEQAVFYSNRAACYTNVGDTERVVADTTEALRLDPKYVKALSRRGGARESLGGEENLFGALCDFTAAAIIDGFKTEATSQSVDRVMRKFAADKASRLMKAREKRLPSAVFVHAYLEAFRKRPLPYSDDPPPGAPTGDATLRLADAANEAGDYAHAFTLYQEAIEQGLSSNVLKAWAHNMSATYKFIMTDPQGALVDLEKAVKLHPSDTQNYIKRASVHMELGDAEAAFADFEAAEGINADDPDIYYHRGQVHFIMGAFEKAREEYLKSIDLDPTFVFSHIQRGVAEYKDNNIADAEKIFRKAILDFPRIGEVHNYYGEILLDRKQHDQAIRQFDQAIELMESQRPRNVLPMINKALALFQRKQETDPATGLQEAEALCKEAIRIDPQCDVGLATLAQLLLQQNKVYDAVEAFHKSADMARNETDLTNALTYEAATLAQIKFVEKYPEDATILGLNAPFGGAQPPM